MTEKNDLFRVELAQATVELDRGGRTVPIVVQALTRGQFFRIKEAGLSTALSERKILALAMVDPPMNEEDVATWQEASHANEMEHVVEVVMKLSGFGDKDMESAKRAAYKSVRGES